MTEYLTKEKYDELVKELDYLINTRRKKIAEELQNAIAMGDLSENAEYHQAREDQGLLEMKIKQIESVLKDVEIMTSGSKDSVGIGATVILTKKGEKGKMEYKIVGVEEANMAEGKVSITSPLAEAMIGKKKGDNFKFEAPSGVTMEYKIINIK